MNDIRILKMKEVKEEIEELLDGLNREEALKVIGNIIDDYGLKTASNLVMSDCEPYLSKIMFDGNFYGEGKEDAGFLKLRTILDKVEEIVNCDDYTSNSFEFTCLVKPETPEKLEENKRSSSVEWWTKDGIDIDKFYIQFQG